MLTKEEVTSYNKNGWLVVVGGGCVVFWWWLVVVGGCCVAFWWLLVGVGEIGSAHSELQSQGTNSYGVF